jgi:GntR family transcriptional repressor for pyruvate dehydrogenase complex
MPAPQPKAPPTAFAPIPAERRTLVDAAAEVLRARIHDGTHPVGSRLPPERILVHDLQISRAVLREALSSLEALGMVEARSTRGRFVAAGGSTARSAALVRAWLNQHVTEIAEFDEIRGLVESHAITGMSAADAADAAARAGTILDDQKDAIERLDAVAAAQADKELHLLLSSYCQNGLLRSLVRGFIEHMSQAALAVYSLEEAAARSFRQHVEIVDALAGGDRELAARLIFQHQLDSATRFPARSTT